MTYTVSLPRSDAALDSAGNSASREYFRFFSDLVRVNVANGELPPRVDALDVRVTALEENSGTTGRLIGPQSVQVDGLLSNGVAVLHLAGDVDQPAALSFYGSLTSGGRGWQNLAEQNFEARDNGDGTLTLDLADIPDSGAGAALVKITRDAKGRLSGTETATTDDLAEGSNLYFTDARADARITLQKGQPSGLASLDSGGKLDAGQLPALAITETFVVNTQAAMLALSAQEGDVAVRTDLSKSFILTTSPPSTLSNWQELLTPASPVTSVFGRVGSVTAASGDYTFAQIGSKPTTLGGYGITDAATAAQGAKADSAMQPSDMPAGYIDGLKMVWVGGAALTLTSGAAYIEGSGKVLFIASPIAKTGLSLAPSTWYHVYPFDNAGTADFELSTTAPTAPYNGTARSKTGDTSRRYAGSVKTDGAGAIYPFRHDGDGHIYFVTGIDTFKVLVGNATIATSVSCASFVPVTGKRALANIINNDTTHVAWLGNSNSAPSSANYMELIGTSSGGTTLVTEIVLDSSQAFQYLMATGVTANLVVRLKGYLYER